MKIDSKKGDLRSREERRGTSAVTKEILIQLLVSPFILTNCY